MRPNLITCPTSIASPFRSPRVTHRFSSGPAGQWAVSRCPYRLQRRRGQHHGPGSATLLSFKPSQWPLTHRSHADCLHRCHVSSSDQALILQTLPGTAAARSFPAPMGKPSTLPTCTRPPHQTSSQPHSTAAASPTTVRHRRTSAGQVPGSIHLRPCLGPRHRGGTDLCWLQSQANAAPSHCGPHLDRLTISVTRGLHSTCATSRDMLRIFAMLAIALLCQWCLYSSGLCRILRGLLGAF
ncbi:hypothetical protein NDU88_004828 [Pleurodeles waltl]|uniref:Uncharacterized protein n=1 Tax=Pleurodeles waltl TaxID=8319 RepID=A0AAV7L100_PLEWA|nr:hypothetical protein NDU88_004828 [Pleurodeles waltl]